MDTTRQVAIGVGLLATLGAWAMGLAWVVSPEAEREQSFGGTSAVVAGYTISTTLTVDRESVGRVTIVRAPGQPKAVQAYHEGRIDGPTLVHELGGDLGVRDDRYPDECVRAYRLTGTTIDIETANDVVGLPVTTVTISEAADYLLTNSTSFRVCFPGGMPGDGASGSVEAVVHAFEVVAVTPTTDGADVKETEKRYRWEHLDQDETITIKLRRPALAFLAELPGLSAYTLIPGTVGQLFGTLAYLVLASIPALLLLWALALYRDDLDVPARDIAESIVVLAGTLAVAPLLPLLFSPLVQLAMGGLDELAPDIVTNLGVPPEYARDALQAGLYFGGLVIAGVLVLLARAAEIRPVSRLSGLVGRGIALQLGIMLVGGVAIVLATPIGGQRLALRLAVWLVSSLLVGAVLAILSSGLQHVATGRFARWLQFRWGLLAPLTLWLGIPVEGRIRAFEGASLGEFVYSVNDELFALASSSEILLLVAAIVAAWGLWHRRDHTAGSPLPTWEDALDDASVVQTGGGPALIVPTSPPGTRSATVSALARAIFAGLLVGKVGVIAGVPVALIVAFLVFPFVFNPVGTTAVLAAVATRLRDYRLELARAILESDAKGEAAGAPSVEAAAASEASGGGSGSSGGSVAETKHGNVEAEQVSPRGRPAGGSKVSPAIAAWRRGLALSSPPIVPRLAVLSLGPSVSPWQNAVRATRYGVLLQVLPLAIYAAFFLPATLSSNDPSLWLDLVSRLAMFVAGWAALAFFFGLFYEHLAEPTGLRKGLRLGLILLAITLPWRLLAANQGRVASSVVAFDALELVLFVAALGLLFDLAALGIDGLQWGRIKAGVASLTATSGLRPVAVFAGGLLTAAVVAATSLLEGQIGELVSSVLSPFLPVAGS